MALRWVYRKLNRNRCRVDALQRRVIPLQAKTWKHADSCSHVLNVWPVWYSGSHRCVSSFSYLFCYEVGHLHPMTVLHSVLWPLTFETLWVVSVCCICTAIFVRTGMSFTLQEWAALWKSRMFLSVSATFLSVLGFRLGFRVRIQVGFNARVLTKIETCVRMCVVDRTYLEDWGDIWGDEHMNTWSTR